MPSDKIPSAEINVEQILKRIKELQNEFGINSERVNIVIAGQTGVGKSTLLNAVFGETCAEVGEGKPITQKADWYRSARLPLNILDTKGLEAKDFAETLAGLSEALKAEREKIEALDQPHVAWMCIAETSARVQDADIDIIRLFNEHDIPVLIALTKHGMAPQFKKTVWKEVNDAGVTVEQIIPVTAIQVHSAFPVFGLIDLVDATFALLPKGKQKAFAAAQKISITLKQTTAMQIVMAAAAAAGAIAFSPIPFSDALAIIPIQVAMILSVSKLFGMSADARMIIPLATSVVGSLGLSAAGRALAGELLKLIPPFGTVWGGTISAGLAGGLTYAFGKAYVEFLVAFYEKYHRVPKLDEILEPFATQWKNSPPPDLKLPNS